MFILFVAWTWDLHEPCRYVGGKKTQSLRVNVDMSVHVQHTISDILRGLEHSPDYIVAPR
jgi:hypothetical protein